MPSFAWTRLIGRKPQCPGVVAASLTREGLALAQVTPDAGESMALRQCEFIPCDEAERADTLKAAVERLGLSGSACHLALDRGDFRLLQIPKPEVPEAELSEALRWRIQDMVDLSVEDAEIEFFSMPAPRQGGRGETLSVVVCRGDLIRAHSRLCEQAGLTLSVIDIPQLAVRNLAERLPESVRGLALIHLEDARGTLQLQQGETLYIARELDFGARTLASDLVAGEALGATGAVDRLALEIQRSLDYYESHYGMPPVAGLIVAPMDGHTQALADRLNRSLGVIARAMDVTALLNCPGPLDDATQQRCLPAIGAALRAVRLA